MDVKSRIRRERLEFEKSAAPAIQIRCLFGVLAFQQMGKVDSVTSEISGGRNTTARPAECLVGN